MARTADLALIAAALLGTSSQLIVMAMTAYAMPAHLAFNLAWLWLFLRGGKAGHAGAIAVGFLATGLHQLVFHPLFVAPFILRLLFHRRWGLAALYIVAYAGHLPVLGRVLAARDRAVRGFDRRHRVHRLRSAEDRLDDSWTRSATRTSASWARSLIRFATWQNLLLRPWP